jgi:AcrR family transcriptional regulator
MNRRTSRSEERRLEILKSAAAAFRRRGYHGASVEEIARALRMTKGSLYYYFRNKEAILFACHDYSLEVVLGLLDDVERQTLAPDERLRRLITGFVHLIIDELHGTALTLELNALPRPLFNRIVAKRDRFDRGLRRILREGMDQGLFAPGDPKLLAFAIMGAINWISRWYDPKGGAGSGEIADAFAEYLVKGCRTALDSRP